VGGELIDSALNLYRATPLRPYYGKGSREYLENPVPEERSMLSSNPYETGLKFAGIQMPW